MNTDDLDKVTLTLTLSETEAEALAQFVKRCGWSEWRTLAVDDEEARWMRRAFDTLRGALARAGFAPR
jgi:hypothetical protein